METRKSISVKHEERKEVIGSSHLKDAETSKTASPSVVRTLRSRVITSDTEDEASVKSKTPQSQLKAIKENAESSPPDHKDATKTFNKFGQTVSMATKTPTPKDATKTSNKFGQTVSMATKTPTPKKRLSAANLFTIVEVKEEISIEECKGKVKEEPYTKNDSDDVLSNTNANTCNDYTSVLETKISTNGEEEAPGKKETQEEDSKKNDFIEDESMESGKDSNSVDMPEDVTFSSTKNTFSTELSVIEEANRKEKKKRKDRVKRKLEMIRIQKAEKEEAPGKKETQEDTKKNDFIEDESMESDRDSDSDDLPEAVSFSSAKNTFSTELSMIEEAIRKEKEKRKDRVRRKIEMIRIQKAEKEEKRKNKMKFLEVHVPERLAEDVVSSLPDRPDIPTVKSISKVKKRKSEGKEKLEHKVEEKKNKIIKFDDYIPITCVEGSTHFGVVPLEVASRLPKSSSQSAAEFKQKALFGSRIPREPSKNLLIYRQKLVAGGQLQKGFKSSS